MNREYWELFWTTGMPEAWLMSRDKEILFSPSVDQGGIQGLSSPLAGSPSPLLSSVPGNPENLY